MNASINNTFFDEVPLNTSIDVKTELEDSITDETECLFSQYNEDMEYDCGIDHNKLYTVFPIKEENDPLSLDKNCNCEDLMFIKKEEKYQIKQEELDLADKTIDDSVLENVEDNIQNTKYMTQEV
ncbi:uncharacterized protein LOC142329787 [Lycorma delicatula]|uniref:uncharacterized protein LOC142329787 n=1 Tax=Lycorma delicatula TaxID=130591 RepID=UPI003F517DFB